MKIFIAFTAVALIMFPTALFSQVTLPVGSHPPAIDFKYFPNRAYAVVWRNWNLVSEARIAKTIGCSGKDVDAMAYSMGLPPAIDVPSDYKQRMFITIVRRNWQLLPYDQLLTLLDMSAEQLDIALREDDFLFIKLGSLKPKCAPVRYRMPGQRERERAAQIKRLVSRYFAVARRKPSEPRLHFVKELSLARDAKPAVRPREGDGLRFIYSYFGVFGDPLVDTSLNPYPDGLLARYAAVGVNGIWMPVVLNKMAPGGKNFPEFGAQHAERIASLRRIVNRAGRYGIKVYIYLNEPRAMPVSFFKDRPGMMGVREGDVAAMCTSNKAVREWLINSVAYIFKQVPELGGVFTITASENLTNCASHGAWKECPRCKKRTYADIISGVNNAIAQGAYKGNPHARVIAWDWGWNDTYTPDIISRLPKTMSVMSVSEWAKPIDRGGIRSAVGEYSISAVGPGPRAMKNWAEAKRAGLKTIAKVQFNNTWELSAVPWLPVLDLVATHAANLARLDVNGVMLSWSLGGYPSPNLEIAQAFADNPDTTTDAVLDHLAEQRYGNKARPYAREAWSAFSRAFEQFPYSAGVLYKAPQQYGPANLLFARPTGYTASMVGFPYDDLRSWRNIYPEAIFASQFHKVTQGWKNGLDLFKQVVKFADPAKKGLAENDFLIAKAAYLHFASVANQIDFVHYRDSLMKTTVPAAVKARLKGSIDDILDREIKLAVELFVITRRDSRIGFEASNQYYYVPQDLVEKVIDCEYVRKVLVN
jgi:hypothetical protein